MKKLLYYILWIIGIIAVYLFEAYIEENSLTLSYTSIGVAFLIIALLIEKITGSLYKDKSYFSFNTFFKKKALEKVKLSNIIVLISCPFIMVALIGWIII